MNGGTIDHTPICYLSFDIMAERRLQALQSEPTLRRFVVDGSATGRQLGSGSYGSVEEVCCTMYEHRSATGRMESQPAKYC